MKRWFLILAAAGTVTLPGLAHGQGAVRITWDSCSGVHQKTIVAGQPASLYASVIGHSSAITEYQVSLLIGTGAIEPWKAVPDAWRFDAGGCQGPARLAMDLVGNKACPNLVGAAPTEQTTSYQYDPVTKLASSQYAVRFLNAGTGALNPGQRYLLARWTFDHSASVEGSGTPGVTCGRFEQPMCILMSQANGPGATWTGTNGIESEWYYDVPYVNTQGHPTCPCAVDPCPVPAENSTWGAIKGQYR
jgi:hypothetical protein